MKLTLNHKITYILTAITYIILLLLVIRNLDTVYLWCDESGQFFISKGLNHFSHPFSPEGGLADVLYNNARYNLDPGGFSILLHYWSMVSNHHIWLRLLPFLFFLLTILFIILTIYEATKDKLYAFIGGLCIFMLTCGATAYLLRAYTMELFATTFGLWGILKLQGNLSNKRLFLFSLALSLLITARYSTIMIIFGYSLYLCYILLRSNFTIKEKIRKLLIYGLPLACMVIAIYIVSMRIQNNQANSLGYLTYFKDNYLLMFNKYHLTLYLFIILILFFRKHLDKKFFHVFWPFVIVEILFIILSFMGMQPCDLMSAKGQTLLLLFFISIISSLLSLLKRLNNNLYNTLFLFGISFVITILTLKMGGGSINTVHKERELKFIKDIKDISKNHPKVFVSWWFAPDIRYLYEYSNANLDIKSYKEKFLFSRGFIHSLQTKSYLNFKNRVTNELKIITTMPKGSLIITNEHFPNCSQLKNKSNFYIKEK